MFKLCASAAAWILLTVFFLLFMAGKLAGALTLFAFAVLPLLAVIGIARLLRFLRTPLGSHGYTAYHMLNINNTNKDE